MRNAKWLLTGLLVVALAPLAWAQTGQSRTDQRATAEAQRQPAKKASSAPQQSQDQSQAANVQAGTQISAELLTTLDAHKIRPGKKVVARVTKDVKQDGRTVIHKGARLLGQVTSVEASGNGEAGSQLGVQFDQLAQGHAVSQLNTVVTAVFARPAPGMMSEPEMAPPMAAPAPMASGGQRSAGAGGGGLVGGAVSTVGSVASSTAGTVGNTAGGLGGAVSNQTAAAAGNNASLGAPLGNVMVGSSAAANKQTQASLFTSRKGNLRLDSGTQMELQVTGQSQVRPQAQSQPPPKR